MNELQKQYFVDFYFSLANVYKVLNDYIQKFKFSEDPEVESELKLKKRDDLKKRLHLTSRTTLNNGTEIINDFSKNTNQHLFEIIYFINGQKFKLIISRNLVALSCFYPNGGYIKEVEKALFDMQIDDFKEKQIYINFYPNEVYKIDGDTESVIFFNSNQAPQIKNDIKVVIRLNESIKECENTDEFIDYIEKLKREIQKSFELAIGYNLGDDNAFIIEDIKLFQECKYNGLISEELTVAPFQTK